MEEEVHCVVADSFFGPSQGLHYGSTDMASSRTHTLVDKLDWEMSKFLSGKEVLEAENWGLGCFRTDLDGARVGKRERCLGFRKKTEAQKARTS